MQFIQSLDYQSTFYILWNHVISQFITQSVLIRSAPFTEYKLITVLITGASGQIGTELVPYLRQRYGVDNVIASDVKLPVHRNAASEGPFVFLDTTDYNSIARVCMESQVDWIFHMAALLSAVGEKEPKLAIKINNEGVQNVLEVARMNRLRVYIPSSIAAFGESTPQVLTPQLTVQRPRTIYGITKVYSELLGKSICNEFNPYILCNDLFIGISDRFWVHLIFCNFDILEFWNFPIFTEFVIL